MPLITRRAALAGAAVFASSRVLAQAPQSLQLYTAGQGSAFLPYGQGLSAYLATVNGPALSVLESKGSIENLQAVNASAVALGLAFLGSAHQAVTGAAWANGDRHVNVRALFPMYDTSFQIAALRTANITTFAALNGKRVGVGPAAGPAELYFKALATAVGIQATAVVGAPADLGRQLVAGEIDALWQGAISPIPALTVVQAQADVLVFGLNSAEVDAMLKAYPFMAAATVPANAYKHQTEPLKSFSAWNFVVAHKDLSDEAAYALTRTVLSASNPATQIHPFASGTRAENAVANRIVPFHPGALRFLTEKGVKLT